MRKWTFVDDGMPPEGEYVLVKNGVDGPVGISRFIDDEWDTGMGRKRPIFTMTERFMTSADPDHWMPLPL